MLTLALALCSSGSPAVAKTRAATPNGTIQVTSTGTLASTFTTTGAYPTSAKQLVRPFVQVECYRDPAKDGSNSDLVYASQVYVLASWQPAEYSVTIDAAASVLAGTVSVNLLGGSSRLVSETGPASCKASLAEWGTNLARQTSPLVYASTPLVQLDDPRV